MNRIVCALSCLLVFASFSTIQAAEVDPGSFIRERGKYTFDGAGSSIEVITAKDDKPSLALDFRSRSKNSMSSNKMSFTESGILRADGWFVFVESPERIWIFDGKKSLAIVERRETKKGSFTTNVKDFDAESAALCPVKVKEALPEQVRINLFEKHPF